MGLTTPFASDPGANALRTQVRGERRRCHPVSLHEVTAADVSRGLSRSNDPAAEKPVDGLASEEYGLTRRSAGVVCRCGIWCRFV